MPVAVSEKEDRGPPQRRPQRQMLVPFPADAPKEPDRSKMKDEIEKLRADVNRCKERIEDIKSRLSSRASDPVREKLLEEKKALIQERKELDETIMQRVAERNAVQERLKKARAQTRDTEREVRELNKELRDYKSVEAVDAAIKQLEFKLETGGSGGLKGERRVMQELKALQAQRSKVAQLDEKLGQIQAKTKDVDHVGGDQRELQRIVDELRDQSTALREKIDKKQEEIAARSDQGQMQVLREEKEELHKKIGEYFSKMDGIRAKFEEDKKKYDEFRAEHKKKEDAAWERKRQEQAAERARREEERRARDLEIAAVKRLNPHEEEIAMCESLIAYLQGMSRGIEQEHKRTQERKHFDAAAAAGAKGLAVLGKGGKGEDEYFSLGKKKPQKPKPAAEPKEKEGAAPGAPAKARPLQHPYPKMAAFETLGVPLPRKSDEVKGALEKLREKVAHFRTFIRSEKAALEEEKAAQEAAKKEAEAAKAAEETAAAAEPAEEKPEAATEE